jgi:hypothetical protein
MSSSDIILKNKGLSFDLVVDKALGTRHPGQKFSILGVLQIMDQQCGLAELKNDASHLSFP